jgi:catecholate siderophore receptor
MATKVSGSSEAMGAKKLFGLTSASVSRKLTPWFATTAVAFAALVSHSDSANAMETPKDAGNPNTRDAAVPEAGGAQATALSQTVHDFKIPSGPLGEVAEALQKETGITFIVPGTITDLASPGVKGVLTVEEALKAALVSTGISVKFTAANLARFELRGSEESVTVMGEGLPSLKYTAPLRDLPMTISVIPETIIENTASTGLVEALRTVSGITFGAGEGGNPIGDRPYIRGVDAQSSTFVDNMRDIGSQSREVFDVASIDVSKGPSGGYAGRGASGGSININSKMAARQRFVNASFSPGSASFFRGTVDANSKLTNWAYGRLAGMATDNNVAGRDQVHANRYGFAPSLLFNMGKRTRLYTNYYDLRSNDMPDPGIPYNNPTFFARVDGLQRIYQAGDGQPLVVNRNAFYGITSRDFRYEKVKTAFGRVEVDLKEGLILRNSYRYGKSNQDYAYSQADDSQGNIYYGLVYSRALSRNTMVDTNINQTDLAGNAKTGFMKHNFATGFEFARERSWNATNTVGALNSTGAVAVPVYAERNANGGAASLLSASRCPLGVGAAGGYYCISLTDPSSSYSEPWRGVRSTGVTSTTNATPYVYSNSIVKTTTPTRQITGTRSLYGFDTIQFMPQLQATVGVRYDHYDTRYRSALTCVPTPALPCAFNYTSNLVNYQAGVVYKPLRVASIYGSVANASTPPGNSLTQGSDPSAITTPTNQVLPPEKTRSEEVGAKWELFGGKALATAAYFQQDTENVRITQADGSIVAAGKRRNRGLDTGISGYITKKWQIFGGYTYMSAILVEAGGAGTAAGLMNGRRFPNTPQNSFVMTSYYQVTRKLNLGGGVYATGKVFGNDSPTAPKWVPAYGRVDIFGSYAINKHFDLQGNMQNLGDKIYFLQAYTTHYAQMAPGRQGRLTLNVHF